jgi:hypothetical protein
MNQIGCHKESPCIAILIKQKCHFFLLSFSKLENWRKEQSLPVEGVVDTSVGDQELGTGCKRVYMVQILYTQECKWKKRYLLKLFLE